MKFKVTETVFSYPQSLLDDWKSGCKDWIPESLFVPQDVHNQPNYHFGEYYALKQYLELGWHGTAFYALGDWEPNNDKYNQGRAIVAKYTDPIRLAMFKALRKGLTSGEPEHHFPQTDPSGASKMKDVDRFGNLCLISPSSNSRLSNYSPQDKKKFYQENNRAESLKQAIMMSYDEWGPEGAGHDNILKHEAEMIKVLCNQ